MMAIGIGGGDSERGAERLAADAVAFAHDDVQDQDEHRLGNPVGLGPAQRHPDRRGGTENESEHARHPGGDARGKVIAIHDPWSAEPSRQDDAVERRDREDRTVDHGVGHRGDGRDERGGIGNHQQRGKPPEPDPGAGNDTRGGQQSHPPPVIRGIRAEPSRYSECRGDVQHAVGAAEFRSDGAEQHPGEHRRDPEFPDERADHQRGQDEHHHDSANDVHHSPHSGRLVLGAWVILSRHGARRAVLNRAHSRASRSSSEPTRPRHPHHGIVRCG